MPDTPSFFVSLAAMTDDPTLRRECLLMAEGLDPEDSPETAREGLEKIEKRMETS